jgi:cysteine desulfurase
MQRMTYLDYNATAPLKPAALRAMSAALQEAGNPSSVHAYGRLARRIVDQARQDVAALVGARVEDVIFTSGGTEANNLALASRGERRLIVSAIEHDSILKRARIEGAELIRVQRNGEIDLDHLRHLLCKDERPAFVSLMLANNETGVIQPVVEATRIAHEHGALLHCDAVQAAGKAAFDLPTLGADMISLSAHKFGGPQGIGALVLNGERTVMPALLGGGQERFRRAGTENVAAIAGFGAAAALAGDRQEADAAGALRDALEDRLAALGQPITIFGRHARRLPNTSCFACGTKTSETLVMALDLAGVAVSAGSACSSGKVRPSHVISAMGFDAATSGTAIRVSFGWASTPADLEAFVAAWSQIRRRETAPGAEVISTGSVQPAA